MRNGPGLLLLLSVAGLAIFSLAAAPRQDPQPSDPVPTPLPSITAVASLTATPIFQTSSSGDDFSSARILFPVTLPDWSMGITIRMPAVIKGEYRAIVGETFKEYTCAPETDYQRPDWLFCYGRLPAVDKRVPFQIYEKNSGSLVFSSEIYIPISILYSEIL